MGPSTASAILTAVCSSGTKPFGGTYDCSAPTATPRKRKLNKPNITKLIWPNDLNIFLLAKHLPAGRVFHHTIMINVFLRSYGQPGSAGPEIKWQVPL